MWLLPANIPKLGMVLSAMEGEEPLIGPSLALPMVWVSSPPYFFAATETICDLANINIKAHSTFKSHPLDETSEIHVPPEQLMPLTYHMPSKLVALPKAICVPVADQ
jgi:hypothetical protein